jgi:hypothetical protein
MTAPATHGAATSAARRLPLPGFVDGTLLTLVIAAVILWFAPSGMGRYGTYVLSLWLVMSVAVMGLNLTLGYAGLKSLAQAAFMGIGALCDGAFDQQGWAELVRLLRDLGPHHLRGRARARLPGAQGQGALPRLRDAGLLDADLARPAQ